MGLAIGVIIVLVIALHVMEMGAYKLKLTRTLNRLLLQDLVTESEMYIILFCDHEIKSRRIRPLNRLSLSDEGFLVDSKGRIASYSIIHHFIKRWYGTTNEEDLKKLWINIKTDYGKTISTSIAVPNEDLTAEEIGQAIVY